MLPNSKIRFQDLSGQKTFSLGLEEDLTVNNTVDQAIDAFLDRTGIPDNDLAWSAFSRGARLNKQTLLGNVDEEDDSWTVIPSVSAGAN